MLPPVPRTSCNDQETCIRAILAAARSGQEMAHFKFASRLKELSGLMPGRLGTFVSSALAQRELATSLLQAGRLQEAERELKKAIATFPTHAPYWSALAVAFGLQGKSDDAVAALVAAHAWADNPGDLLRSYERGAKGAVQPALGAAFRDALALIAAQAQAAVLRDMAAPFQASSAPAQDSAARRTMAVMDFTTCTRPNYPEIAIENNYTGTVELAFYVDAAGTSQRITRVHSSGHIDLDNAVVAALASCSFRPATLDGAPVPARATIKYRWTLE